MCRVTDAVCGRYVQEFVEARKRHLLDSYGMSLAEVLADPELQQVIVCWGWWSLMLALLM